MMYKSILLPIDIAHIEHNKDNITAAMKFSDTPNTIWHLIYIETYTDILMPEYPGEAYNVISRNDFYERMNQFADTVPYPRDKIKIHIGHGSVMYEILAYANDTSIDLIIINQGRPRWSSFFVGSLASNLARETKIPLLIIPADNM